MSLFPRSRVLAPPAGRSEPISTARMHFVNGRPLSGGRPDGLHSLLVGMGCFWGAERLFWSAKGVWVTSVGYAGGLTPNPTYEEVCTGNTGHAEVVEVVFDPKKTVLDHILARFWEGHDPTQGDRQGNDRGSQYRSVLYASNAEQLAAAKASAEVYARRLAEAGLGPVTTKIGPRPDYYLAEEYHQQYLAKNPDGYCGLGGTGVRCPTGPGRAT